MGTLRFITALAGKVVGFERHTRARWVLEGHTCCGTTYQTYTWYRKHRQGKHI